MSKKYIKNLIKRIDKTFIEDLLIILTGIFYFSVILIFLIILIPDFIKEIGELRFLMYVSAFTVITSLWYGISTVWNYFLKKRNEKMNLWLNITFYFITIFLFIGGMFIIMNYSEPKLSLKLRNSENPKEVLGDINCEDNSGRLIAGNRIYCEIQPQIKVISANVSFRFGKNSMTYDFSDLNFIAPKNIDYIYFKIRAVDELNKTLNLEIGNPIEFYTEQKYNEREDKFITYFIWLLGAVLFSVPHMMRNFKYLAEK